MERGSILLSRQFICTELICKSNYIVRNNWSIFPDISGIFVTFRGI